MGMGEGALREAVGILYTGLRLGHALKDLYQCTVQSP